eukprot:12480176-Alexandrium_andersonii.AAC.1
MSASLVGSEMCIRDRDNSDHPGQPNFPGSVLRQAPVRGTCREWHGRRTCLLYTSDAADDM